MNPCPMCSEQVARLEANDLQMINALGGMTERCYAAEAERDRLRTALEEYGQHPYECPASAQGTDGAGPCTCGLAAALAPESRHG